MSACELGYMYKDVYFSIVYPSKKKKLEIMNYAYPCYKKLFMI